MPPVVNTKKCTGCRGRSESHCEEICPGDLMAVDESSQKAFCRAPADCWDCMSCIKVCPSGALETRLPYQIGYFKASLRPILGKNTITWKCTDINGKETTYQCKSRNVPIE